MEILRIGENCFSVRVTAKTTANAARQARALTAHLRKASLPGVVGIRSGLDTVLIECEENFNDAALDETVSRFHPERNRAPQQPVVRIPVCNEPPFSQDLNSVAEMTGLPIQDVLRKFFAVTYEVWMIGFMPGYPYMGRLDSSLQIPRKETPALNVPAQSVAIADEFVGVYPFDSPGGWHVIGRTPLSIIDYSREKPWLFDYEMRVQFYAISKNEFEKTSRW